MEFSPALSKPKAPDMRCPQCHSENRDDRTACYHCEQDLTMLCMVINRAKNHYNNALEHAERGREEEAVAELKHALELDASFTAAWTVLGTLYAKKEMFDDAKDAWGQALALDPHMEKCHGYLEKAETISRAVPAIKRLQIAAAVLALIVLALGATLAVRLRPQTSPEKLSQALDAAEADRLAESMSLLGEAADEPAADETSRRAAIRLLSLVEESLSARLERIEALAERAEFSAALAGIADLQAQRPPPRASERLTAILDRVRGTIAEAAQAELKKFKNESIDYAELEARIEGYEELLGDSLDARKLRLALAEAGSENQSRMLDEVRAEMMEIEDLSVLAAWIRKWSRKYPVLEAEFEEELKRRFTVFENRMRREIDAEIEQGELGRARKLRNETFVVYERSQRKPPHDLTEAIERAEAERRARQALAAVEKAHEAQDWMALLEATKDIASLPEAARTQAAAWRRQAGERIALETWKWANQPSMDSRIEGLRFSEKEALDLLERFEVVLEYYPKIPMFIRRQMLFYAAAAAHKLGRYGESDDLLDRVIEPGDGQRKPNPYFTDTVEKFRAKNPGRLGKQDSSDSRGVSSEPASPVLPEQHP